MVEILEMKKCVLCLLMIDKNIPYVLLCECKNKKIVKKVYMHSNCFRDKFIFNKNLTDTMSKINIAMSKILQT